MVASDGKTEFSHIPDWYEWEKQCVKKEIESGKYFFKAKVHIDSLPNSHGPFRLGDGQLIHDKNGFNLSAVFDEKPFSLIKPVLENYGVHIEYHYFEKGDAVILSTLLDTFYLFPFERRNVITKLHFATEILYELAKEKKNERA